MRGADLSLFQPFSTSSDNISFYMCIVLSVRFFFSISSRFLGILHSTASLVDDCIAADAASFFLFFAFLVSLACTSVRVVQVGHYRPSDTRAPQKHRMLRSALAPFK